MWMAQGVVHQCGWPRGWCASVDGPGGGGAHPHAAPPTRGQPLPLLPRRNQTRQLVRVRDVGDVPRVAAAAEGAELDGPAAVVRDFEAAKLLVDLKVVVDNPIVGEKPLTYVIELSRMDVERGFIESQDRDAALTAIITGNNSLMEDSNELDFEEYLKCVAFCGLNMFRNVKRMPGLDRIETLLNVYVGPVDTATPADRLRAAVKRALSKGLERFDPLSLEEGDRGDVSEEVLEAWAKMDLSDCHGFPLWEKEARAPREDEPACPRAQRLGKTNPHVLEPSA